jgi:sugar/nucleoside kinase (ribokinase family)
MEVLLRAHSDDTKRSIAVLGTLTRDTTVYADGSRSENLGGTHYSILTLAHLFQGRARIVPVANVGSDAIQEIHRALDLPGLDRSCLHVVPEPNNHVYLTYRNESEREEVLEGLVPPLTLQACASLLALDWILVNLTSGKDVTLEAMEHLRQHRRGTLQLDVHSLTLGFREDGRRFLLKPPLWKRWVACADWVQMNESEANLLGDGRRLDSFVTQVLDLGPQGVVVTLGERGSYGAWWEEGRVCSAEFPAQRLPERAFPTGCGDVFGAAFAFAMLEGAPPRAAMQFANAAAGAKACHEPYGALEGLRRDVSRELHLLIPSADPRCSG